MIQLLIIALLTVETVVLYRYHKRRLAKLTREQRQAEEVLPFWRDRIK